MSFRSFDEVYAGARSFAVSVKNRVVSAAQSAVKTVRRCAPAILTAGAMAFGTVMARAVDAEVYDATSSMTTLGTNSTTLFNTFAALSVAAVVLGIVIKFVRRGSGR
ncbi:MAG: hypothetical protein ACFUZC_07240 [Chthoniobacteraceae bacterium]